ncbi:Dps family protein [Coprobacter tertius]|uniref:DNA starvation/stationary phase protection protein n=1 Tax=Coprobacter tertius TaxID=2944915 RepID=A0ABT1MIE0_9BACT|nr:Dps family protein [Coprobacter tertius]MCP9612181.1 DNA starvation/stationary phase protection protein [Coprobacter tertius]
MKTTNYIHLDVQKTETIVNGLQQLLADFQVYYTNLRGFHWNIKGQLFFALHSKFEELYNDAAEKVDEIAERILMLGGVPEHNFSSYLKVSRIKETAYVSDADEALKNILETYGHFIEEERKLLSVASDARDEVTVSMMSDFLAEQEKLVWMLSAFTD